MKKILNRLIRKANWHNLRSLTPLSKVFAFDRGTPIDRVYIEHFLESNKHCIKGTLCEIGENSYSQKFANDGASFEILHYTHDNPNATIVGDLTDISTLPESKIDCFILTQTLNFIYDFKAAILGLHYMLSNDGIALVTVSGISQISRYDMDRWGDYWRFTDLSIKKAFEEVFGIGNVEVGTYGNVLTSIAFLEGISAEELTVEELFYKDQNYQMTITIKAKKQ